MTPRIVEPTAPVAPTTATRMVSSPPVDGRPRRPRGWIASSPSSNAACSRRTASGTSDPRTTHEILIGDVEIISMFTPASPSTLNVLAATPGCDFMPAPTSETLPMSGSVWMPMPYSSVERLERVDRVLHVVLRHGERHVGALALGHRLVLDDHVDVDVRVGQRREDAARDAGRVRHAGQRDARLVGRVGDCGYERSFHRLLLSSARKYLVRPRTTSGSGSARRGCARTRPSAAGARRRPRPTSRASPRTRPASACARRARSAGRR